MKGSMAAADITVVALYFVTVMGIGFFAMWRSNRSTVSGYFLAGRSMTWIAIGASLFVSNIGSEHFIGLAGSGAASGLAVAAWELNALLLLQLLGWVFVPVYIRSQAYTMPDYLSKRYGSTRIKVYFAVLSLVLYIFTKISVDLYAGALFIQESLGWNLYASVILLIGMTALLTITGGLVAVIYTDTVQALLMVVGALTLMTAGLLKVGGFEELKRKYLLATPNVTEILMSNNFTHTNYCRIYPKPNSLKMLRDLNDEDTPWLGFLLGQTPASVWYWCADQVIVQRVLAAKNIAHAKGATLMAGFLKILPMFIIVVPGMISRVLFPNEVVCINPEHCMAVCGSRAGCSNIAYPHLVMNILPVGLRGLMMSVMIAALMSDLDSIFNSASTIFTLDIYKYLRKTASSRELMIVGRVFVVFMVGISIAWVPIVVEMQGGETYLYIQEVAGYLTPPVAALFLLGVFWKRCNEHGAFCGAMTGSILGVTRMILAFVYREPDCDQPDNRPYFIKHFHYMYFAACLFWITGLTAVFVSLLTASPKKEQIQTTTIWAYWCRKDTLSKSEYKVNGKSKMNYVNNDNIPNGKHNGSAVFSSADDKVNMKLLAGLEDGVKGTTSPNNSEVGTPLEYSLDGHATLVRETHKQESQKRSAELCWKCIHWFCGYQKENGKEDAVVEMLDDEVCLQMLEETPKIQLMLNIGLLVICIVGIFMFTYFSL
ncbi:sodium/myo-inositol cotransporter-like [Protopterus annectens]|uniref:sodium/myo-inositol cotransporter-like n=1 Tax=Protopterus annectens TaxID=7888 RepID=UPI001CFB8496|nr:sodium/myo-inositol cotransporter-like [Protopterus annectens]XP_043927498.1 sodium/myo-inositol cotransporter-like [Protopterus annectens]XP_043927499.1 sodium/myo-inositol cotransporter-like [Protopterus annectens]